MQPDELGVHADTLALINDELTARLARQSEAGAAIDTKAVVLVGYALVAVSFLATQHPDIVLASFAYAAYAIAVGYGIASYAVGSYSDVPAPRALLNGYGARPKTEALAALSAERVLAFESNATRHSRKASRWRISLAVLLVGVTFTVVAVVAHNGHHDRPAGARQSGAGASAAVSASRG